MIQTVERMDWVLSLSWSSVYCVKGDLFPLTSTVYENCKVRRAGNVTCVLHNSLLILGEALSMLMSEILSTMRHSVPMEPGLTPKWGAGVSREKDMALHGS